MIDSHTHKASAAVLVQVGGAEQQGRLEENRSLWQAVQIPAEISEAHLRVGMDCATPVPLLSVFCRRLTLVEPCLNTP